MSAEVADLLDRAAQRIRKKGWIQGQLGWFNGPCCALGAIAFEAGGLSLLDTSRAEIALKVAANGDRVGRLSDWNDEPGRTVEQVLDAFARAAAAERAK